jgi:hypothetical protein
MDTTGIVLAPDTLSIRRTAMTLGNKRAALVAGIACLASAWAMAPAGAQVYPENGSEDIRQTVARLSFVSGDVSFARGDAPDEWQLADPNVPVTLGDRIWTAAGRLELQVHGGHVVRIASDTDLTVLNLTEGTKQLSLAAGTGSFEVPRLGDDEIFEVDTPNAAITFERPGNYRIDVRTNGDTRLQVRRGRALVASAGGQVPLGAGDEIRIEGVEAPRYDLVAIARPDDWDRWVEEREARYVNARSYQYVSRDVAGVVDLDQYGRWQQIPSYGWCWTPLSISVGWAPYRVGRWIWQDPWGWTWVSTEPWGWAPYHYGRWVVWGSRWYWVPVAPRVAVVAYSPALVAFVGGGPGFSVSAGLTTDYVGWFPLAPRDPLIPWWGRPGPTVSVTHVTYVNRTYVTVVNQTTFVSSRTVTTNIVHDSAIVTRVERAPVVRGAIPVIPTQASIRVSTRSGAAARPPAAVVSRSVVTRVAPPPAPPRFEAKEAVIRENRGRPVSATEANLIITRERSEPRPARPVRPAAEPGRVSLAPANQSVRGPRPEPVAPVRGRTLATKEEPVAAPGGARAPASGERPAAAAPPRTEREQTRQEPTRTDRARPQAPAPPAAPASTSESEAARKAAAERQRAEDRRAEQERAEREADTGRQRPPAARPSTPPSRPPGVPSPERQSETRSSERAPARPTAPPRGQSPESTRSQPRPAAENPSAAPPPTRGRGAERPAPRPHPTKKPEKTPREGKG